MGDNTKDHLHDQEEAEEALSFCDLPLNTDDTNGEDFTKYDRRSSSEPPDFFEFFCDLSTSEMCPADDIIFCGKLVPFKHQSLPATTDKPQQKQAILRKRSESLPEIQTTRSNSTKSTTRLMRNSRSLDSRKLDRSSSSDHENDRSSSSGKSFGKSDSSARKVPKSPWYLLMFGSVKFPPEMELRDIKNRQVRQNPTSLIPAVDPRRRNPVNRSGGKGSWGLLRALSCKDPTSAAVTSSFSCVSHV